MVTRMVDEDKDGEDKQRDEAPRTAGCKEEIPGPNSVYGVKTGR